MIDLVFENLIHIQNYSLVAFEFCTDYIRGTFIFDFALVRRFFYGFLHSVSELLDAILSPLPFWTVHQARDHFSIVRNDELSIGPLTLWDILDSLIFWVFLV